MTRVLTVVQGAGIDLHGADMVLAADPAKPLRFNGEVPLDGILRDGKIVDFNLIHHAQHIHSEVKVLLGPCPVSALATGALHVLHCISGEVSLDGIHPLAVGDTALIPAKHKFPKAETSGTCILMALSDQRDASNPVIASR